MARAKKKAASEAAWERYHALQLTAGQKAAARAEVQNELDLPATRRAYHELTSVIGKVTFSGKWDELMRDDD